MKYPNTLRARNLAICEYHKAHPEVRLRAVGKIFGGITKQRVSIIIKKYKGE